MSALTLRPASECRYDAVSLGEVMLRLDPGEGRIRTARTLNVYEGGGEYNVARSLRRAFGLRTAIVTALADNEVGRLLEDLILTGGVDTSLIRWVPYDGIGRTTRVGLNFTERGFGVRGAVGVSDRGNSAASQLGPDDVDWDYLFGSLGVRWLHTGGIFAALSETSAAATLAAVRSANRYGTAVSYDLNYRPSLWKMSGGATRARELNRRVAPLVDVMIGVEAVDAEANLADLDDAGLVHVIERLANDYPNLSAIATTLRTVHSATLNDWGAAAWSPETGLVRATPRPGLEILDRIGGGDSFASGLVAALLEGRPLATAVEWGAAHGALAMTTPGDTSMATRDEVLKLAGGADARVDR
jgi:2-dehydro-3-deoxygluconokinase